MVTDYSQLTMSNVAAHATTYTGHHSQDAKNSEMLYQLLIELLMMTFKGQLLLYKSTCMINKTNSTMVLPY